MAVGIIIGAAFGKIVSSLVNDIIMPPIGMLLGKMPFSSLSIELNKQTAIKYGLFVNNVLEFLIVAFCIFLVVRQINHLRKMLPAEAATTKSCPECLSTIPLKAKRCMYCTSPVEG